MTTGDGWSAANHNTYIKNNFAAGVPDIFTAAGDIAYATAADVAAVLAKGTAYQVLRMNAAATAPEWGSPALCQLGTTTPQNVPAAGSGLVVSWNVETFDELDWHESVTNPTRITPNLPGNYKVSAQVSMDTFAAGDNFSLVVFKNAGSIASNYFYEPYAMQVISPLVAMNGTTDYFMINVSKDSSTARAVSVAGCWFLVEKV